MVPKTNFLSRKSIRSNHRTQKSARIEKKSRDEFSDLHINLKHLILRHLPTHEIARTSILSSKWRRVIYSHPTLNFDVCSFKSPVSEYLKSVLHIVSNHTGLLEKFTLYIPYDEENECKNNYRSLVQRIVSALPKSAKYLHVKNEGDVVYPLSIRGFEELTHLKLDRCSLDQSQQPKTLLLFPKLTNLDARQMSIPRDLGQPLSCIAPRLERLHLRSCYNLDDCYESKIDVSSVTELFLYDCQADVLSSPENSKLTSFGIFLTSQLWSDRQVRRVTRFCRYLHKLTRLEIFSAYTLKMLCFCLNKIGVEDGKPTAMEKLIIHGVNLNEPCFKNYYPNTALNELLKRARSVRELWIEDTTAREVDSLLYRLEGVKLDRLTTLSFTIELGGAVGVEG